MGSEICMFTQGGSILTRVHWGAGPRGEGPLFPKNWDFWDIKVQIFGNEGAENFDKSGFLTKNRLFLEF